MDVATLRKLASGEEVDYPFLLSALSTYARPRDKISSWLQSGQLIRVKKGLYVFGKDSAHSPYSLEILANLIYGPSAISLTYALSYYGLIPERVALITSITPKRNKQFSTPVGNFSYSYLALQKYSIGIALHTDTTHRNFLIASPEKALCDQLLLADKEITLHSVADVESYLLHDLRVDEQALIELNHKKIKAIAKIYQSKKINLLFQYIQKIRKKK